LEKSGKRSEEVVSKNKFDLGDCFSTDSGRLKRRGAKKIYHCIIRRYPNDFTSIYVVQKALSRVFEQITRDKVNSVAICGIGIEPGSLDKRVVARVMLQICEKYKNRLDIKIIDDNSEFIDEINNILKQQIKRKK